MDCINRWKGVLTLSPTVSLNWLFLRRLHWLYWLRGKTYRAHFAVSTVCLWPFCISTSEVHFRQVRKKIQLTGSELSFLPTEVSVLETVQSSKGPNEIWRSASYRSFLSCKAWDFTKTNYFQAMSQIALFGQLVDETAMDTKTSNRPVLKWQDVKKYHKESRETLRKRPKI